VSPPWSRTSTSSPCSAEGCERRRVALRRPRGATGRDPCGASIRVSRCGSAGPSRPTRRRGCGDPGACRASHACGERGMVGPRRPGASPRLRPGAGGSGAPGAAAVDGRATDPRSLPLGGADTVGGGARLAGLRGSRWFAVGRAPVGRGADHRPRSCGVPRVRRALCRGVGSDRLAAVPRHRRRVERRRRLGVLHAAHLGDGAFLSRSAGGAPLVRAGGEVGA
jgi:hypothetical protein